MFKTKRRKELEAAEKELYILKSEIREMMCWCANDSPEIGFAMKKLLREDPYPTDIHTWREKLRNKEFTWDNYVAIIKRPPTVEYVGKRRSHQK